VLVVFTGTDNDTSLVNYGLLRMSTFSLDSLLPVIDRCRSVRERFMESYTREGNYFGGSLNNEEAKRKRTVSSNFFTSLRRSNYGNFKSIVEDLDLLEKIRGNFVRSSPFSITGSSLWDEYLKLALCCGISTGKSSLTPVVFSDETTFSGTGGLIDNIAEDNLAFYKQNESGTIKYNRATRNGTLYVGKKLKDLIQLINNRTKDYIEQQTGQRVPFLNVDYRLCANSFDDVVTGNFELVPVEIHPDTVDFINDGLLFEANGTLPLGTVQQYVDDLVSTIDSDIEQIQCPQGWNFNSLYRTEITFLQESFRRVWKKIPEAVVYGENLGETTFNYPPFLNLTPNAVPSNDVVSFLNSRELVAATLEEAVCGLPNVRTARSFILEDDRLGTDGYFSLRKIKNFDINNPRAGYDFVCFLREILEENGLTERSLYVIKPNDHSVKKSRPVTFYDISGMQTLLDYTRRYGKVIVEEVDRCLWSERSFNAGSVSEIKTISLWRK